MKSFGQVPELRRDGARIQTQTEGLCVSGVLHGDIPLHNLVEGRYKQR